MAHLTTDLRPCCKGCVFLGYYDDHQSSWYFCSLKGDGYNSIANKQVDRVITTVLEKRDGDIIPLFYNYFASDSCSDCIQLIDLLSFVETNSFSFKYKEALIHVLKHYKN